MSIWLKFAALAFILGIFTFHIQLASAFNVDIVDADNSTSHAFSVSLLDLIPVTIFLAGFACLAVGAYRRPKTALAALRIALLTTISLVIVILWYLANPSASSPSDSGAASYFVPDKFQDSINLILTHLEGSFGALLMTISLFLAIITASIACGAKKRGPLVMLSFGFLLISIACFIGRSFMVTFKPVIYLYPQQIQDVEVKLHYKGILTVTYPTYDPSLEGWRVRAFPNGKLINQADQQEHSYLFWEGNLPPIYYKLPAKGFIVPGEKSAVFLQDFLSKVGLLPVEYNEFIVYWYPQIKKFPYVQISLAGSEYEDSAGLEIKPKPDSILRVFVYFHSLSKPVQIEPQDLEKFERRGFSVVEWGGTILP